ncbi:MAG TPA: hypothetical protein VH482_04715 [Thermomicrobiales bacterium]|jgi:hypothetical protein
MLLLRSMPNAAGAPRRLLAAFLLRAGVTVTALTTLVTTLIGGFAAANLDRAGAFLGLAVAVVAVECGAVSPDRRSVGGARGVTFALLLTAQMCFGLGAAAWLGVIAAFAGAGAQRCGFAVACERAALVVTLLTAGEWLAGPGSAWFPFVMGGCAAFFSVWLLRIRKRVSYWNLGCGMLVRAWVMAVATHSFWPLHGPLDHWVTELSPLAARVAGALLADLLVVITLTIGVGALDTLDAWAIRMPPVVLRVHLLALTALPLIALERNVGSLALVAGALLLATVTIGWRRRSPPAGGSVGSEPPAPCQRADGLAANTAVHVAYCLTI